MMKKCAKNKACKTLAFLLSLVMVLSVLPAVSVDATEVLTAVEQVSFDGAEAANCFDLYSTSAGGFAVQDGKLTPAGDAGEFKAIYKDNGEIIRSVSVEIHPAGTDSPIYGGLYINAGNASNGQDLVDALYIGIESNFSGWDDAPNRLDVVLGEFAQGWVGHVGERLVSETGKGNALFSGGIKEPITLRADISSNVVTVTVSLVSNPAKNVTMTYTAAEGVDLAAGDVGIRSHYNDAGYDNFQVNYAYAQQEQMPAMVADFGTSGADQFQLYSTGNGGFAVENGKLAPSGEAGEFKAIYQSEGKAISSVSVELHPAGADVPIYGGLYINAANASDSQDAIDALYIGIESHFTGWDDAANRIDLVMGSFPAWTEHSRTVSETGNGNNLFSGGIKEPLVLRADIYGNSVTATVSLLSDPSRYISTTYVADTDLSAGSVGIRSHYNNARYDNFAVNVEVIENQDAVATVGTYGFGTVDDAVDAAKGSLVQLLTSSNEEITVAESAIIDLAGHTLTNVVVAEGCSLKLIDTVGTGSAAVSGNVESVVHTDGKTYLAIGTDGVYTAKCCVESISQQVSLGDNLAMNFVVEADQTTTVQVSFAGQTTSYDLSAMTPDENGRYTISVNLAAAQMTEDIVLQFMNSDVAVLENTYSVRRYAEAILNGNFADSTKNIVSWMLQYGAKAQQYFGVNEDTLANDGYELAETSLPAEYEQMSVSGSIAGMKFYGASLVFTNKIAVRFYFTGSVDGVSFSNYEVVEKDGMYYVEVAGINPQDYSKLISLTATKGDETMTVSYSPLNYILRMSEKGSSSLKALLNALYGYHEAAVRYLRAIGVISDLPVSNEFTTMSQEEFLEIYTIVDEDMPAWTLGSNGLVLTSQKGELFAGDNLAHNLFLQNGDGNWVAETKLTVSQPLNGNYQQGGLVIYEDMDNYMKLVYGYGDGATKVQMVYEQDGVIVKDVSSNLTTDTIWLRIQKQGNTYTAFYVTDINNDYQQMGQCSVELENTKLGFTAYNGRWSDAEEIEFTFEYLRILDVDTPAWPQRLYDMELSQTELRLNPGNTIQLDAEAIAREEAAATAGKVVYTSSDENIVTVDENGLVTAVGEGYAVITANVENGYPAACAVSVMPEELYVYNSTGNPYLPIWEHIPDGEPYVFEDPDHPGQYRVYVYGSHDTKILLGHQHYCGYESVVWSAPVEDLTQWTYHGEIFKSTVQGTQDTIYAPDIAEKVNEDGTKTYYYYPNNQSEGRRGMVTKSSRPDGPFVVCNWAEDSTTTTDGVLGFDVAVLLDDDGRAYGYWGFENNEDCCWAELNPEDMSTLKEGTEIHLNLPTRSDIEKADYNPALYNIVQDEHVDKWGFFEAPSIRKVGNKYILLFSRRGLHTEATGCTTSQLAYGYSDSPAGPWKWGGIIVDANGETITDSNGNVYRSFPSDNTHGSICEVNGQWYIFYHRSSNAYSRQSMLDPITLEWDEKSVAEGGAVRITMAEVTSQGAHLDGMDPYALYPASIVSYLTDGFTRRADGPVVVPEYNKDTFDYIKINTTDTIAGVKYFDLDQNVETGKQTSLTIGVTPLGKDVTVDVYLRPTTAVKNQFQSTVTRDANGNIIAVGEGSYWVGSFSITADMPQQQTNLTIPLSQIDELDGKWGLFFVFRAPGYTGEEDICYWHTIELSAGENSEEPASRYTYDFAVTVDALADWTIQNEDAENWSYVEGEGLKIKSQNSGIYGGSNSCENVFLLPASGNYIAETKITLSQAELVNWQQFALLVCDDQDNYIKLKYGYDGGYGLQLLAETNGAAGTSYGVGMDATAGPVWLQIKKVGYTYTGYWSTDGVNFQKLGETITLQGFDPAYIGLAAFNDGGTDEQVEFTVEYVDVQSLNTYDFTAMTQTEVLENWSIDREDSANWSFAEGEGLKIKSQRNGLYGGGSDCKNIFMLPAEDNYTAEIKVSADQEPGENWQQFALLAITDQENYVKMKYGKDGGLGWQLLAESSGNPGASHGGGLEAGAGPVWLRIVKSGNSYTGYYSTDGITFHKAGDTITVDGLYTTHIGLAAYNDGGTDSQVEFTVEYVRITEN